MAYIYSNQAIRDTHMYTYSVCQFGPWVLGPCMVPG